MLDFTTSDCHVEHPRKHAGLVAHKFASQPSWLYVWEATDLQCMHIAILSQIQVPVLFHMFWSPIKSLPLALHVCRNKWQGRASSPQLQGQKSSHFFIICIQASRESCIHACSKPKWVGHCNDSRWRETSIYHAIINASQITFSAEPHALTNNDLWVSFVTMDASASFGYNAVCSNTLRQLAQWDMV